MWTFFVAIIIGFIWLGFNRSHEQSGRWADRRRAAAWAWAFVGALIGSFFGVAGLGSAIAGTIPGAIVGYLIASNLMKRDYEDNAPRPAPKVSTPAPSTAIPPSTSSLTAIGRAVVFQVHRPNKTKWGYLGLSLVLAAGAITLVVLTIKGETSRAATPPVAENRTHTQESP